MELRHPTLTVDLAVARATSLSGPNTRDQLDEGEVTQMNIIGERGLGLPPEPGLDPNTPWSQIPRN